MKRTFEISYNDNKLAPGWLTAAYVQKALSVWAMETEIEVKDITDEPVLVLSPCDGTAEMEAIAKRVLAESLEKMGHACCTEPSCDHRAHSLAREARRLRATLEPAPDPNCPGPCPYHKPLAWAEAQEGR